MPITAFIGVRISWLIVARNEPFAALASSAMRVCSSISRSRRALATAIAACSAKVCSKDTWSSVNPPARSPAKPTTPTVTPLRTIGTTSELLRPAPRASEFG